jgi:ATP-dependent DNA ligase
MIREITAKHAGGNVSVVDVLKMSVDKAKAHSVKEKWEGLVMYDKLGRSGIRLDGKSDQPIRKDNWKWKKYKEGDFVAIGWRPSTSGRYAGLVKDFVLIQYHPDTGEAIPRGHVGGGLSGKQKAELAKDSCYPLVVEVEYESLTGNGLIYNGHILRIRDDKRPHECVAPRE